MDGVEAIFITDDEKVHKIGYLIQVRLWIPEPE